MRGQLGPNSCPSLADFIVKRYLGHMSQGYISPEIRELIIYYSAYTPYETLRKYKILKILLIYYF